MRYDIAMMEKPLDEGLTKKDIALLYGFVADILSNGRIQVLPIEIAGDSGQSIAMGFITMQAADKLEHDFEASGLSEFVGSIIGDEDKKEPLSHDSYMLHGNRYFTYEFQDLNIWLN